MTIEPLLDADDIQGHIIPGYADADLRLLAIRGSDAASLRSIIRALIESPLGVTTMGSAFGVRSARKLFLQGVGPEPEDPLRINLALTRQGIDRLGVIDSTGVDPAFDAGMTGLSTGDPKQPTRKDGSPEPAYPPNWEIGGANKPFDMLVILACKQNVRERTKSIADTIEGSTGISIIYQEFGEDLPNNTEHFGFVDGISTPGVYGEFEADGGKVPITTRYGVPSANGLDFGKPGQPLVWPGRFIVGAPSFEGDEGEEVNEIFKNGSFLVFRRLQQDVAAFYEDTDAMAKDLANQLANAQIDGNLLRETIVGRRQNGQPLMRSGLGPDSPLAINHFFYANSTPTLDLTNGERVTGTTPDLQGQRCPFWAHIRKVNPRDGQNDLPEEVPNLQMLRRGIAFGPAYEHQLPANAPVNLQPRGLLFLAYQRSIGKQFEELNTHWMNQFEVPAGGGHDLLVGLTLSADGRLAPRRADWPSSQKQIMTPRTWVIPTGGAYLFAPSLTALKLMAGNISPAPA
jgi:Dyp-type peroxidase family